MRVMRGRADTTGSTVDRRNRKKRNPFTLDNNAYPEGHAYPHYPGLIYSATVGKIDLETILWLMANLRIHITQDGCTALCWQAGKIDLKLLCC